MSVRFTSKSVKVTGAVKGFVEKKLDSIEKISGDIIGAEFIINEEKELFKVEVNLKTKYHSYQLVDSDVKLKQAFRQVLSKLKNQAKKNKEKLKGDKKIGVGRLFAGAADTEVSEPAEPEKDNNPRITVSENYSNKPLSVEEAVFYLQDSGENAFMFENVETGNISVIFKNNSGDLSLIDKGRLE